MKELVLSTHTCMWNRVMGLGWSELVRPIGLRIDVMIKVPFRFHTSWALGKVHVAQFTQILFVNGFIFSDEN